MVILAINNYLELRLFPIVFLFRTGYEPSFGKECFVPHPQVRKCPQVPFVRARHGVFLAPSSTKQIFSRGPGLNFLNAGRVHQHRTVKTLTHTVRNRTRHLNLFSIEEPTFQNQSKVGTYDT